MQLSKNFTLAELTATSTGLPNTPGAAEIEKLQWLAEDLLQPIRDRFGAIDISSGFRSPAVNRAVGSKNPYSQHIKGEAVDFIPKASLTEVFDWIVKESGLQFGQCIMERVGRKAWIHISLHRAGKPNQQALTYNGKEYKIYA